MFVNQAALSCSVLGQARAHDNAAVRSQELFAKGLGRYIGLFRDGIIFGRQDQDPQLVKKLADINSAASAWRHTSGIGLHHLLDELKVQLAAEVGASVHVVAAVEKHAFDSCSRDCLAVAAKDDGVTAVSLELDDVVCVNSYRYRRPLVCLDKRWKLSPRPVRWLRRPRRLRRLRLHLPPQCCCLPLQFVRESLLLLFFGQSEAVASENLTDYELTDE
eukprot:TRINITY_DN75438_c0_g1_i1.p1 TRINITY_DN75438_c0_g1~~TRINITY_DN75438_c0_g1_i1.p1  ORF type:complete len:218 (+),score=32.64 TRINITY_DN75438_c0_g1_i1:198-851(+)